jgi:hypothetical protein
VILELFKIEERKQVRIAQIEIDKKEYEKLEAAKDAALELS